MGHLGSHWWFMTLSKTWQLSHQWGRASCAPSEGMNTPQVQVLMSWYFPGKEFSHLSHFGKGGHRHDKKHYPILQDLLLIDLFPYLAQNPAPCWTKVTLSLPSPSDGCAPPLHLGNDFVNGQQSTLLFLQKVNSFGWLTINIPVSHKVIFTNSEYCKIGSGNHMLQICSQTCAYFICSASLII